MARAKLNVCTYSVLILLVFSYGIIPTEERLMKMEKSTGCKKYCLINAVVKIAGRSMLVVNRISDDKFLDEISRSKAIVDGKDQEIKATDFAPTTPGHSPGVGHGNGPSSSGPEA
ncbi:hypothetical protein Salat_0608500 [Sesamum alatum]|uniref:Uncharacterized protein n=1 Tax=Sesamum alatum TaxID=300844 RepID=A0AAE1YQQ6_9LAMI|nr:hypothetical protein Salat_0608500 [Sesamum alatum]